MMKKDDVIPPAALVRPSARRLSEAAPAGDQAAGPQAAASPAQPGGDCGTDP